MEIHYIYNQYHNLYFDICVHFNDQIWMHHNFSHYFNLFFGWLGENLTFIKSMYREHRKIVFTRGYQVIFTLFWLFTALAYLVLSLFLKLGDASTVFSFVLWMHPPTHKVESVDCTLKMYSCS